MSDTTSTSKGLQPYIIQEWVNGENTNTPLSAERLTHMEVGIGDLSKALLDGREPSYTVTSETAPAPSTPCILVVIDSTGLYKGTWRDDGKTRTQVGWGPAGDQELYSFARKRNTSGDGKDHSHDWATLTRHGVMVDLSGSYTLEDNEKDPNYAKTLDWIKIPLSCQPPHELYSKGVTQLSNNDSINTEYNYMLPRIYIPHVTGVSFPSLMGIGQADKVYFHAVWMTDAAALPTSVARSAIPEAAEAPAPAAPAAASQQTPAVQAPAPQATPAQEQAPASQPGTSQALAQQEQTATQAPAVQAAQEQTPAQASPAHAAPEQAKDVQAPAVQDAPAHAASTARHAKPGLEE